jgi:hypothetical protein
MGEGGSYLASRPAHPPENDPAAGLGYLYNDVIKSGKSAGQRQMDTTFRSGRAGLSTILLAALWCVVFTCAAIIKFERTEL